MIEWLISKISPPIKITVVSDVPSDCKLGDIHPIRLIGDYEKPLGPLDEFLD